MEYTHEGKLEWKEKFWDNERGHFDIGNNDLDVIMNKFDGKNIRLTIEIFPDEQEEDDEPTINLHLNQVVRNEYLCNALGYNPYCVQEGADGTAIVQVKLSDAKKAGII